MPADKWYFTILPTNQGLVALEPPKVGQNFGSVSPRDQKTQALSCCDLLSDYNHNPLCACLQQIHFCKQWSLIGPQLVLAECMGSRGVRGRVY